MNRNIIYSCYSCPIDKQPKFLDLHIDLIKTYANKCKCDYKIMDIKKSYIPPVFTVYEAYKEFVNSTYDNMLYIDWDVLISLKSDNIFNEYNDSDFVAYRWRDSFFKEHVKIHTLDDFNNHVTQKKLDGKCNILLPDFITDICKDTVDIDFLEFYVNEAISGGVMMFNRHTMSKFLDSNASWEKIYNNICNSNNSKILKAGGVLSHFAINYLLYKNKINITNLDKKWNTNSVTGKMSDNEFFYNFNCGGDELANGVPFTEKNNAALKYVINNKPYFFNSKEKFTNFIKKYNAIDIIKSKRN